MNLKTEANLPRPKPTNETIADLAATVAEHGRRLELYGMPEPVTSGRSPKATRTAHSTQDKREPACLGCGASVPVGAKHCFSCHGDLTPGPRTTISCGACGRRYVGQEQ